MRAPRRRQVSTGRPPPEALPMLTRAPHPFADTHGRKTRERAAVATGFAGSLKSNPRAALNGKHGRGHPPGAPTPMLNRQRHAHLPSEPRHPAPAGTLGYKLGESAAHVPSGAKASSASWYPCPPARGKCRESQSCACECGMAVRAPTEAAIPRGAQTQTRMARGIITWHRNTSHRVTRR